MNDFDRGYLYGVCAVATAFIVWRLTDDVLDRPTATKLVVLDRRDMADGSPGTSERMAHSGENDAHP